MLQVRVSENYLRQFVTDEDIFRFYIPQFKYVGEKFNIDENDKNPSAGIFKSVNGSLLYKNHRNGACVNAIQYVMKLHRINYATAIQVIASDLNIPNVYEVGVDDIKYINSKVEVNTIKNPNRMIRVKRKGFNAKELAYWSSYGISEDVLRRYKVSPLSVYWLNGTQYIPKEMVFCYHFPVDDDYSYKLYFPINKRFLSSTTIRAVQGYEQLDRSKELLIITKSLKDVMFLSTLGINAVAPQSESCKLSTDIAKDLVENFNCYIWYDNDRPGLRGALRLANQLGFKKDRIHAIPQRLRKEGVKDPTDMRKIKGHEYTMEYINKLKTLIHANTKDKEEGSGRIEIKNTES